MSFVFPACPTPAYRVRLLAMICLVLALATSSQAATNPDAIAVIVGNKTYSTRGVPSVDYADRDADAMRRYVIDVLGYDPQNVLMVSNASLGQMIGLFGTATAPRGRLARLVGAPAAAAGTDVFVYYSGHGFPGLDDHKGYLLPVDADPMVAESTGYGLDVLVGNLEKLGARSVVLVIDACFSGDGSGGTRLVTASSAVVRAADPVPPPPHMTILTASGAKETANWDLTDRHGLFTEYFLRAVYGAADDPAYGGKHDGRISAAAVKTYLDRVMSRSAARDLDREQTATLSGNPSVILATFPASRLPTRPPEDRPAAPPVAPAPAPAAIVPPAPPKPPPAEAALPDVPSFHAAPAMPSPGATTPIPPALAAPPPAATQVVMPPPAAAPPPPVRKPVQPVLAPARPVPRPAPAEAPSPPRAVGGVKCLLPDGSERNLARAACRSSAGVVLGAD